MDEKITKPEETMQIPKYVFDKEYSTQWRREVQFLEEKGINYTFGKRHHKYPIIRYKYTKTPELFLALAEFYNQVRNEKYFKKAEEVSKSVLPIEKGCIELSPSEMTEAEKRLMNVTEQDIVDTIQDDTE